MRSPGGGAASACAPRSPVSPSRSSRSGSSSPGIGTMVFLRNALIASLDAQLEQLAPTGCRAAPDQDHRRQRQSDVRRQDGRAATDYFVAALRARRRAARDQRRRRPARPQPVFPETHHARADARPRRRRRSRSPSAEGGARLPRERRAPTRSTGVTATSTPSSSPCPSRPINQVVAQFLGIYGILALIILIVAGAFLTRWLVTLTFRSLGQVESTAMTIAAGDFSQRMTDIEPDDDRGRAPQDARSTRCSIASTPRSRSATPPCARCAGSSATRATSCARRS